MSNISSKNKWSVILMRWVARLVSIPWAYWALAIAWFVAGNGYEEGMSLALYMIIVFIAFLPTVGAAIIAGVWGKEALGGAVLLADGALIVLCFLASPHIRPSLVNFFTPSKLPFNFTMVLPPLLAGSLFLVCHQTSKASAEQQPQLERSNTGDSQGTTPKRR
ncbi:MAG TPA: hypothetical protein G4O11_11050 [Anaerolineae bacterium]|nr:hypothetical protein [Anaerolineae bacterium]